MHVDRCRLIRTISLFALAAGLAAVLLAGSAAAAEDIDIDVVSPTPNEVRPGDTFDVSVNVSCSGSCPPVDPTIRLEKRGTDNVIVEKDVSRSDLTDKSPVVNKDLTFQNVEVPGDINEDDEIELIVRTDPATTIDGFNETTVNVSYFTITDLTANPSSLAAGNPRGVTYTATVHNNGTKPLSKSIYLNRSGTNLGTSPSGQINPGQKKDVRLNHQVEFPQPATDGGETYTYTVDTANSNVDENQKEIDIPVSVGITADEIINTSTSGQNLSFNVSFSKLGSHKVTRDVKFKIYNKNNKLIQSTTKSVTVRGENGIEVFRNDTGQNTFTRTVEVIAPIGSVRTTIEKTKNKKPKSQGPTNFSVDIQQKKLPSDISAGDDLKVGIEVDNTGNNDSTQTISLRNGDGAVQNTTEVTLAKGNKRQITLTWESVSVPESEPPTLLPIVTSSNTLPRNGGRDQAQSAIEVKTPIKIRDVSISSVTLPKGSNAVLPSDNKSMPTGSTIEIDATVFNDGTETITQTITLFDNEGNKVDTQRIFGLSPQAKRSITFTRSISVPKESGSYSYTVEGETPAQSASESITAGEFTVNNIERTIVEGTTVKVIATVSKIGDYTNTKPVRLTVDGNPKLSKSTTIEGDSTERVELSAQLSGGYPKTLRVITPQPGPEGSARATISKANIRGLRINSVADTTVQSDDELEFTYTAFDPSDSIETVKLEAIDPNGEVVVSKQLTPGKNKLGRITIPGRDAVIDGGYDLRITVTQTNGAIASSVLNSAFVVSNAINPDAIGVLGEPVTRSPAGDFVSIPTGGEYMLIGGDKRDGDRTQFLDVLHVSGGSAVLNTRLVGTNVSSSAAYGDGITSYAHKIGANAGPAEREGTVFEGVSFQGASSLAAFREKLGIDSRTRPLQAGRYRLAAGSNGQIQIRNGAPAFDRPVGRSNLVLTQTQRIGEIKTYVAPPAAADESGGQLPGEAVEGDTVTLGERLIIEVPATGIWGAMLTEGPDTELTAERIATLLRRDEGVHIEFDGRRGGPNAGLGDLQFESVTSSDISVSATTGDLIENETVTGAQPIIDGYYIVIDTRGTKPFSTQPDPGSVFEFEMAYESPPGESYRFDSGNSGKPNVPDSLLRPKGFDNDGQPNPFDSAVSPQDGIEHFPYFGDGDTTVERNATVRFTEPSITYARTRPDGSLIVPAEADGQIFGSTTMVPGSQVTIRLIGGDGPTPELVEIVETTVEDDRTFAASADFSQLTPGQRVEVEFASQNRLEGNRVIDKRSAYVVDNFENPARFQITSFAGDIQVQQRDALDDLQATITNNGSIAGRQLVEFRIAGEPIRNETITIGSGGSEPLDLSGQFVTLPTGTYQYTVATDDDQRTGQLTVGAPDTGTVITDTASQGATTSGQIGGGETTGGTDDGDDSGEPSGLFSLMGVRTRDVAVATAIAGATHILGYWT